MITDSPHIFRTDWNLEFNYSFDKIKNEIESNLDKTKDFQFKPTFDEYLKKDIVLADKEKYKDEYEAMQRMSKGITQLVLVGTALHKRTGDWVSKKLQNLFPETFYFLSSIPKLRSAALNILEPGTLISPHTGLNDGCIKGHLVIKSNEQCKLFVQIPREVNPNKIIQEEGDLYFFDDGPLHWAGNRGKDKRIILVADFYTSEYNGEFKPLIGWTRIINGGPSKSYSN